MKFYFLEKMKIKKYNFFKYYSLEKLNFLKNTFWSACFKI